MSGTGEPPWIRSPPSAYDIVAYWYPEDGQSPGLKLRPALVTAVLAGQSGLFACRVSFGTKSLKPVQRGHLDLIVQNSRDIRLLGLARATRFDLDHLAVLPWTTEFFGCWTGFKTPVIGSLTEPYIKDYAFLMMRRQSANGGR